MSESIILTNLTSARFFLSSWLFSHRIRIPLVLGGVGYSKQIYLFFRSWSNSSNAALKSFGKKTSLITLQARRLHANFWCARICKGDWLQLYRWNWRAEMSQICNCVCALLDARAQIFAAGALNYIHAALLFKFACILCRDGGVFGHIFFVLFSVKAIK